MFLTTQDDRYEMNLNILRANRWEMVDERTNKPMKGVTLITVGRQVDTSDATGADFGKMAAEYNLFSKLKGLLPGTVRCVLEQKQSGGKMVPIVVDVISVPSAATPSAPPGYAASPGNSAQSAAARQQPPLSPAK